MNDLIKQSIDSRKAAIFNMYEVIDQELINKIEDLFNRMMELGNTCSDNMDFETKLATSPLNQEYINLFTELSGKCSMKTVVSEDTNDSDGDSDNTTNEIASELKYQADELARPIRREIRQEAYDKVRDVPVVGDVLNVKQHVDFFSRFKKKK